MTDIEGSCGRNLALHEWLFSLECRQRYSSAVTERLRRTLPLVGTRYIQVAYSELLMVEYDLRTETIHLEIIDDVTRIYTIASPSYIKDKFVPIALVGPTELLIFSLTNEQADFHIVDLSSGPSIGSDAFRKCGTWSVDAFFKGSAFRLRVVPPPRFGCAVSKQGRWVVILGPPETFLKNGDDWGCKLMDVREGRFVKKLCPRGYRWVGAACFHPDPERAHLVAMVGVGLHEYVDDFSRPNTTGTLFHYDLNTDIIVRKYTQKSVSTEILRYNMTGDLIFVRTNSDKKLCIMNSETLVMLRSVDHDVSKFPLNHYSYSLFYRLFPLISISDESLALIQWDEVAKVEQVALPVVPRNLLKLCRLVVLRLLSRTDNLTLQSLHIPTSLVAFLLWS